MIYSIVYPLSTRTGRIRCWIHDKFKLGATYFAEVAWIVDNFTNSASGLCSRSQRRYPKVCTGDELLEGRCVNAMEAMEAMKLGVPADSRPLLKEDIEKAEHSSLLRDYQCWKVRIINIVNVGYMYSNIKLMNAHHTLFTMKYCRSLPS